MAVRHALPIGALFAEYEREVSRFKKGHQSTEDRRRMDLWQAFLGAECDVSAIDKRALDRFVRERRAGNITVPDHEIRKGPSETTIGADIVFLQSVLNWATEVTQEGRPLLERNPVRGYERPRTANPKRPVATYDRYLSVRGHADQIDPQGLFGAFLDLAEALGWRVTAICELWASDVDRKAVTAAPQGRIRKREAVDKEGVEMWVPLSESARAALDQVLARHPAVGDVPLFPSPKNPLQPWTRWHARNLLERAEEKAELAPLPGGDWHPYRRKWATERKHLPVKDVAAAGGWKTEDTLVKCYQATDEATLLAVVTAPQKLREAR